MLVLRAQPLLDITEHSAVFNWGNISLALSICKSLALERVNLKMSEDLATKLYGTLKNIRKSISFITQGSLPWSTAISKTNVKMFYSEYSVILKQIQKSVLREVGPGELPVKMEMCTSNVFTILILEVSLFLWATVAATATCRWCC